MLSDIGLQQLIAAHGPEGDGHLATEPRAPFSFAGIDLSRLDQRALDDEDDLDALEGYSS
jgi:hypothetical protein